MLFSKGRKLRNQTKKPSATKFQMLVEDVRDGVLVFEDETEAAKYCDLLQGGGQGCEGVAEVEASSVRIIINLRVKYTDDPCGLPKFWI
ncbi:hypothetical protein HanOQP8_Chr12g0461431 [Helianthus annuus]|nr:hypothetical protein HanOQP8_Chr12g0461431 [Helianthus annuus]